MWKALFDAVIFCITNGFPSTEVYDMLPHVLEDVYQSLKRKEAQENLVFLYSANQAYNGTKESITKFSDMLSMWLPGEKEKGKLAKYRAFIQGKNLKKGRK